MQDATTRDKRPRRTAIMEEVRTPRLRHLAIPGSRRWFLLQSLAATAAVEAFSAPKGKQQFWDTKDPAAWTPAEKDILLYQSPWAQAGYARMEVESKLRAAVTRQVTGGRGRLGDAVQTPTTRPGEPPYIPSGTRPLPNIKPGDPVQFPVLARWETATPVRQAGGPPLPPDLGGQFYVIRLRGLPLMPPPKPDPRRKPADPPPPNPNEGLLHLLKQGSRLERKDKEPIACTNLFTGSGDTQNEVLLFFPRQQEQPITLADRFVTLECWFDPFHLSVRFSLKEMLHKGELSL